MSHTLIGYLLLHDSTSTLSHSVLSQKLWFWFTWTAPQRNETVLKQCTFCPTVFDTPGMHDYPNYFIFTQAGSQSCSTHTLDNDKQNNTAITQWQPHGRAICSKVNRIITIRSLQHACCC